MTGEKLVGFGASFDGSGLVSTGTVRELIEGTEQEHVEEDVFALGGVTGGGQGFAPSSQSVYGAFEALAFDRGAQEQGALQHEATDQIVGDGVHEEFAKDHVWALAAQDGKFLGGFKIVEIHLHVPATQIEGGDLRCGPGHGIEQGRGHDEFFVAMSPLSQAQADLPHDDLLWKA